MLKNRLAMGLDSAIHIETPPKINLLILLFMQFITSLGLFTSCDCEIYFYVSIKPSNRFDNFEKISYR